MYLSGIEELLHYFVREMQMIRRKMFGCLLCVISLCLCGCGQNTDIYLEEYEEKTSEMTELTEEEQEQYAQAAEEEQRLCYVYICGAVSKPGVYVLPEGGRIYEVLELAGGLLDEADDTLINQAEVVNDGMMIQVYTKEEAKNMSKNQGSATAGDLTDARVDINTAGISELMSLPGIGTAKAEAILSYRKENGGFSSIEDLMNVPGIKEGIFQQMKDHIKVN